MSRHHVDTTIDHIFWWLGLILLAAAVLRVCG